MNIKYYGKKIVRDDFGNETRRFKPCVVVNFTDKEEALALKRLDATGYKYDLFADGLCDQIEAYITVSDREEADVLMDIWREVKQRIKSVRDTKMVHILCEDCMERMVEV